MIAEMEYTSDSKLATAAGMTRQTLSSYRQRGFVGNTVAEVLEWKRDNIRGYGQTNGERNSPQSDLDEEEQRAKIEKLKEENRKLRLANDEKEGRTVDMEFAELQATELTNLIRARLESIAGELEPEWPPEVRALVTERMKDKISLILTEMSQWRLGTGE